MATTIITDHTAIPGVPTGPGTVGRLVCDLQERFAGAQGDADKATELDAVAFAEGLAEAYHDALNLITDCVADGHCEGIAS